MLPCSNLKAAGDSAGEGILVETLRTATKKLLNYSIPVKRDTLKAVFQLSLYCRNPSLFCQNVFLNRSDRETTTIPVMTLYLTPVHQNKDGPISSLAVFELEACTKYRDPSKA